MSKLKTDFRDEILPDGDSHRVYNIKKKGTNAIIESDVYLEKAYTPRQEGDEYGAREINELNTKVNDLSESSEQIKTSLNTKQNAIISGTTAPNNGDGRADGTIYIQIMG